MFLGVSVKLGACLKHLPLIFTLILQGLTCIVCIPTFWTRINLRLSCACSISHDFRPKKSNQIKSILFTLDSVRSVLNARAFQIELEFRNVGFCGEGKTGVPGEKPLGAEKRTNNKLNPHMTSSPRIEPGPHWWKASALTTAPSLLPDHPHAHNFHLRYPHVSYDCRVYNLPNTICREVMTYASRAR